MVEIDIKKRKIYEEIVSYLGITIGLFLYVLAWKAFLIPNEIVGGGATGVATVVHYITGQIISVSSAFFILNAILLVIGFKVLGKGFGIKTIYGILFAYIMLAVLPEPTFFTASFDKTADKLILAILGGVVSGFGIAITFKNGGSAGGTDIVAMIVSKYKNISPGKVFLYADLVIISSSFFINWDFRTIVYGYVTMVCFSYSVDLWLSGIKQSVQIIIISDKYAEIADEINAKTRRGVTALRSVGWFSKREGSVLIVVVRKRDLGVIHQIIKQIDNQAFVSESSVMGVYGQGFDSIKV